MNVGEIDLQIAELTRQISQDEEFLKKSQSELKILNSTLSVQEIKDQLKTVIETIIIFWITVVDLFVLRSWMKTKVFQKSLKIFHKIKPNGLPLT